MRCSEETENKSASIKRCRALHPPDLRIIFWDLDLWHSTWTQQLIFVSLCNLNLNSVPGACAWRERAWCLRMWRSIVCGSERSAALGWVRWVRVESGEQHASGDLWNTCSAGERSPDKNHNCLNMSGDNEETQTAEETPVEEKVNAGFSSRAPGTVASW